MLTTQRRRRTLAFGLALYGLAGGLALIGQGCDEFLKPRPYRGPTGDPFPVDGGGASDGGDSDGGVSADPVACSACVSQLCPSQSAACQQSSDCTQIDNCVNTECPYDESCVDSCASRFPAGQALYDSLYNCDRTYVCTSCYSFCYPDPALCQ